MELRGRLSWIETEYSDALSLAFSSSKGDCRDRFRSLALGLACRAGLLSTGPGVEESATASPWPERMFGDFRARNDSAFELAGLATPSAIKGGVFGASFLGLRSRKGEGKGQSMMSVLVEA